MTDLTFKVLEDYATFGEGNWKKHIALVQWGDKEPKIDIRAWNDGMTKCGKGLTLTAGELKELGNLIQKM